MEKGARIGKENKKKGNHEAWKKKKKRWVSKEAPSLVVVIAVRHLSVRIYFLDSY